MAGRNAQPRGGARAAIRLDPSNVPVGGRRFQEDCSRGGVGAGTGTQEAGKYGCERAAAQGPSSEKVGPNVVFGVMPRVGAPVQVGLVETMRAKDGRVPWLGRHLTRLRASVAALGAREPADDLAELVRFAVGHGDRVVRLELTDGHAEITTREVKVEPAINVVVADEVHHPYPHKTTQREQFGRALANARRIGANDAVLLTADGIVAEGTAWNLFWWENGSLRTPAADLGILPGLGRARIMELTDVKEERVPVGAIAGRSLFIVNAVRGIVEVGVFDGAPVPRDPRTAELASSFWPY